MKVQILKPGIGDYTVDQIVEVEDDVASMLIETGYAQEVPQEQVEDEEDVEEAAASLSKSLSANLAKNIDAIADKVAAKVAKKAPAPFSLAVAAEAKDGKCGYKSMGDFAMTVFKATVNKDFEAQRKLHKS